MSPSTTEPAEGAPVGRTAGSTGLAVAVAGLIAGAVLLGVGLGLVLPYATKAGADPVTALGVIVVAGAAALLWWSGRRVLRRLRGWWRLAALPVAGVLLYTVTAPFGIAVAATNVPSTALGAQTPADRGIPFVDASYPASDGTTRSGWYLPGERRAAVVLRHGAGSTRSAVLDHAIVLHDLGYGVLMTDARGHGRSGGRAMDFGWYGDDDLDGAVSWLQDRPDVDPERIGVVGLSMGGEEALGAAAADPRLRVVVAEGATGRTAADGAWLSDSYGVRGWLQERVDAVTFGIVDLLTPADPPTALREAAATTAAPILLVAAGDVPEEADAARWIAAGAPDRTEVWVVDGAAHTGGLEAAPEEWRQRVGTALDRALGGG